MLLSTDAVVLRIVNYGDSDRIVTLLGQTTGKVTGLARGARNSKRRFPGLMPGGKGEVSIRDRGGDMVALESFVADPVFGQAPDGNLGRAAHAAYALELCERLCAPRHQEHGVFALLVSMLSHLNRGQPNSNRLRIFEQALLQRLGFAAAVDRCVSCGRADFTNVRAGISADAGGLVCHVCGSLRPLPPSVLAGLARLSVATLEEADDIVLDPSTNAACREVALQLIYKHTSTPLKSLDFIAKMTANGDP